MTGLRVAVLEIDGHNMEEIASALNTADTIKAQPTMIIAHTIKGKGCIGGLTSAMALAQRRSAVPMDFVAINDVFGESAHHPEELQAAFGLTADNIAHKARELATGKP